MQQTKDITSMLPPGEQLRLKRMEYGLDINDVAHELCLSKNKLLAIEADDYASLPGSTYIVGYWRSYASLLKIDINDSIEQHRKDLSERNSGIVLRPNHQRVHGYQEESRKKSAFLFLLLSSVFLGGIWYWQNPEDNPLNQWVSNLASKQSSVRSNLGSETDNTGSGEVSRNHEKMVDSDSLNQIVELKNSVTGKQSGTTYLEPNFSDEFERSSDIGERYDAGSPIENDGLVEILSQEDNQAVTTVAEVTVVAVDPEPEGGQVDEQPLPTVEAEVTLDKDLLVKADEQVMELLAASKNFRTERSDSNSPNWIIFKINAATWLDVRDQTGEKLAHRIAKQGETIELKGIPPFSVYIAISSHATVEYMGSPVEFVTQKASLFSRFQVGEAQ